MPQHPALPKATLHVKQSDEQSQDHMMQAVDAAVHWSSALTPRLDHGMPLVSQFASL